ncbi:MAG: hypothetical protein FWD71_05885 [Oscillospiraceae bacterium]|nr:hypothetical protein [Oscillospiraceae bacterium]
MKIFKNRKIRKKIIRIIIYTIIIAISYCLPIHNQSAARFLTVVQLALSVLTAWEIISFIRFKSLFTNLKNSIVELFKRVFKPILKKIEEIRSRKRKFIRGSDESKFILHFNVIDKLKNKLKLRQKLDFKHAQSNSEKIRLLYIRLILILTGKNYKIRYSYTPKEINDSLNHIDKDILFDIYENVRYGDNTNTALSDDTVKLCENNVDEFR